MKLTRTFDNTFINSVINHPDVREGAGVKEGELCDVSFLFDDVRNVCLVTKGGGFLLFHRAPNTYELHTQFLPEARGAAPLIAIEEAFLYMFVNTECLIINTKVSEKNTGAKKITEQYADFVSFHDGYYHFTLTYESWVKRSSRCKKRGEAFHEQLGDKKDHADDPMHDSYVGSAILMLEANNMDKAEFTYNRWALSAGYAPMVILSLHPVIIQVGDLMIMRQPDMSVGVEKCQ